jgi:NADP-dependent 3-hydroxy acid dehydrogenase YdfG
MNGTRSQVWFITGSSRGLGRALTEAVLAAGQRVVATARKTADLNHFADRYGSRVKAVAPDVTQPEQTLGAVKEAVDAFGRIDVLVNNAGYANIDSAEDIALDDFRAQIDTNFYGRVLLALAAMEQQPRRLLLGSDAYVLARATLQEMAVSDDAHRTLSASTDADGLPDFAETDVGKTMLAVRRA